MASWYEDGRPRSGVSLHRRALALARDPEIPRACRWALVGGLAIPGPLDEVVIYPAVVAFVWFRRRHVLARHGFGGAQVVALVAASVVVMAALGIVADLLVGVVGP